MANLVMLAQGYGRMIRYRSCAPGRTRPNPDRASATAGRSPQWRGQRTKRPAQISQESARAAQRHHAKTCLSGVRDRLPTRAIAGGRSEVLSAVRSPWLPANVPVTEVARQSNISTLRATSPACIARNASFTSSSRPRRVIISSSFTRPCR